MTRAEFLQKVANAQASGGGNNIRDGKGRLVVDRLSYLSGFKGDRFQAEFIVLHSTKIPAVSVKTGQPLDIEPNAPGTSASALEMTKNTGWDSRVKTLILALYGEPGVDTQEFLDTLDALTPSDDKPAGWVCPARGMVIDYETYRKETGKGQEIVAVRWTHVPDQTEDDIKRMRVWLDSLASATAATPQAQQGAPAVA